MFGCTARSFLLAICSLQTLVVIECQIFEFLGFMYGPILANFFHIIVLILGFFGAFQKHPKYIVAYALWNFIWIGWCLFIICFYLDVGLLSKEDDVLSLGTGSRSWWEVNGPGCVADFTAPLNSTLTADPDPSRPPRPTRVDGCWLPYYQIETIQAAMQLILSVFGVAGGVAFTKRFFEDDDGSGPMGFVFADFRSNARELVTFNTADSNRRKSAALGKTIKGRPSQYTGDLISPGHSSTPQLHINGYGVTSSPRPMTPRRVKRRSGQARDSGFNTLSSRSSQRRSARSRASQRRRPHQSPVSRLLEQQNRFLDSSLDEGRPRGAGYSNPVFQQSSNSSINQSGVEEVYRPQSARSSYSNYHASRPISYLHNNEVFSNQAVAQVPINTNRSSAKRVRADLPRGRPSSFLAQGPPAYKEGKDSETVI